MASSGIRRLWIGYVAVGTILAVTAAFAPGDSPLAGVLYLVPPGLALAAMIAGIRWNRPARALPWFVLTVSLVIWGFGNAVQLAFAIRGAVPFPAPADIASLVRYPLALTGLMLLVNGLSWRRDRAGVLDTLMITGGLGLGVWLFFVRDLIAPGMSWGAALTTVALPLGDVLLLAAAIRMLISSARRSPAFWQLAASHALLGLAQAAWVWLAARGIDPLFLAPLFILSLTLLGGAALHPSMTAFDTRGARVTSHITPLRVTLIGSACLLSPVLLIIDGALTPVRVGWLAASVCCIVVFLLVITRMAGLVRTVQEQADRLESMAFHDALTGIPNRRAWDAELERRLAVARRYGGVLIVGLIDIDHFKHYNDLLGHPAGDALLREAANAWQRQLRDGGLIARYGGEEFGLVLHCALREVAVLMARLAEVTPDGQTFSAGLALWTGDESAEQLTARADAALYVAKRDGRDRFTVSGHPDRTDLTANYVAQPST